jgi:glucose-6-phosphate-specific signal transduction histidine kinase
MKKIHWSVYIGILFLLNAIHNQILWPNTNTFTDLVMRFATIPLQFIWGFAGGLIGVVILSIVLKLIWIPFLVTGIYKSLKK